MRSAFFRYASVAVMLSLTALIFFTQADCATTDAAGTDDAGDDSDGALPCGTLEGPCCPPSGTCAVGGFCNRDVCKPQHPNDIGKVCTRNDGCQSGYCGYVQFPDVSMNDAGEGGTNEFPDGGGPPGASVCTTGCSSDADCLAGWGCTLFAIDVGVCTCVARPEACDGKDNNCNGIIDDEPFVDEDCTNNAGMGVPEVCKAGKCECVTSCAGMCVDINKDTSNCGKCGVACTPMVQICQMGTCGCGNPSGSVQVCNGQCVDTATDNKNCGSCGKVCDFTCSMGQCGPTSIPTGFLTDKVFTLDTTNIYWIDSTTTPSTIKSCPISGTCTTPKLLATMAATPNPGFGFGIAVANNTVFWADFANGTVQSCATSGCTTPTTLAKNSTATPIAPYVLTADATEVYWINNGTNFQVMKCAQAGCVPKKVCTSTTNPSLDTFSVDGTEIVWSAGDGSIESSPIAGCTTPSILSTGLFPTDVMAGGGKAVVSTSTQVYTCAESGACTPSLLSGSEMAAQSVGADGTNAYWTVNLAMGSGGGLKKCALGGCGGSPPLYITNRDFPTYLVVGPTAVAWMDSTSVAVFSK